MKGHYDTNSEIKFSSIASELETSPSLWRQSLRSYLLLNLTPFSTPRNPNLSTCQGAIQTSRIPPCSRSVSALRRPLRSRRRGQRTNIVLGSRRWTKILKLIKKIEFWERILIKFHNLPSCMERYSRWGRIFRTLPTFGHRWAWIRTTVWHLF